MSDQRRLHGGGGFGLVHEGSVGGSVHSKEGSKGTREGSGLSRELWVVACG